MHGSYGASIRGCWWLTSDVLRGSLRRAGSGTGTSFAGLLGRQVQAADGTPQGLGRARQRNGRGSRGR